MRERDLTQLRIVSSLCSSISYLYKIMSGHNNDIIDIFENGVASTTTTTYLRQTSHNSTTIPLLVLYKK